MLQIALFINIILITLTLKNALLKSKLYLICLPHLLFSIFHVFKYIVFLRSMDISFDINWQTKLIFSEISIYHFIGLISTFILCKFYTKKGITA